jgi:nucleotide-binding universal stress UspA family protein
VADLTADLEKSLEAEARSVEDAGVAAVHTMLIQGVAQAEIVRLASEQGFDLIVMGTHGRTGLRHALLGSVAEKVVRKASCPVLTVRAVEREQPAASP